MDTIEAIKSRRWAPSGLNNQILKNKEIVNKVLEAPDSFELMGVIALGHPVNKKFVSERKELDQLMFLEKFGENR